MNLRSRLLMMHRFWRYRLRTEKESIRYLRAQNLEGTTLLDIGANKGIYTYWMSKKAGKRGKVISFEPQPELEGFLLDVKKTFHLDNVAIENVGLSDQAGSSNLIRGSVGTGGAQLEVEWNRMGKGSPLQRVEVRLLSLDGYLEGKDPQRISFIKCDVEGHELSVFKGAEKTLRRDKPIVMFECHHEAAKAGGSFAFLSSLGYRGYFIHRDRLVDYRDWEASPYDRAERHRNYIFLNA